MTRLIRDVPDGPRAHALVIGVGHYRHFKHGTHYDSNLKVHGEQLTSPPLSALAFADWLLAPDGQGYTPPPAADGERPPAPLESVELLVSRRGEDRVRYTRPDTKDEVALDGATLAHVTEAFDRWRDHIWNTPDDVGIFYFSGHGFHAGGSSALLLEDFGADTKNPFKQAFDFETTRLGLAQCAAKRQYFFVDACKSALANYNVNQPAPALLSPDDSSLPSTEGGVFYATAKTAKAYSRKNEISTFTSALIDGLNGLGSQEDQDRRWVVKPIPLFYAVVELLKERSGEAPKQIPTADIGDASMHTIGKTPPIIPCTVWCEPDDVHRLARLSVHDPTGKVEADPRTGKRWEFKLPKREYELRAEFDNGEYEPYIDTFDVRPPIARRRVTTKRAMP